MATPSLLDWIMDLLRDNEAREAFNSNPQAALQTAGFSQACGADVADARTFIADTPGFQAVKGVSIPQDTDDPAEAIRYVVNNYTYNDSHDQYFLGGNGELDDDFDFDFPHDGPHDEHHDGPHEGPHIDPDGIDQDVDLDDNDDVTDSTVTDSNLGTNESFNPEINDSFNPDSSSGQTTVDQSGSTVGEDQIGRDNIEGNAGGSILGDASTLIGRDGAGRDQDTQEAGLAALDHVVETGDVHVLSDLVNTDDIARNSLNDLDLFSHVDEQNVVQDVHDLVNVLGG